MLIDIYVFENPNLKMCFQRLLPINEVAMMNVVAAQIPFALIMIVLTYYGYRSSAVFMVPVLSSAVANIIIQLTPLYKTGKDT